MIEKEAKPRNCAEAVRGPSKEENMKTQGEYYRDTAPPRRFRSQQHPAIERTQEEEGFRRETPFKRYSIPMYQTIFLGSCYNFGHKYVNCRVNTKNTSNNEGYTRNSYPRRSHEAQNRSYNIFGSLSDEVKCYKCNNFGNIARDCRLTVPPREPKKNINSHKQEQQMIWIGKQDQFNPEECNLALQVQHTKHNALQVQPQIH
jgi:hypothetical protein